MNILNINTEFGSFATFENDLVTRQLIDFSAHSRNEIAALMSCLRRGDAVLDIGAHIGTFAIPIALRLGPSTEIYSFEPQIEIMKLLAENVARNQLEAQIHLFHGIVSNDQKSAYSMRTDPYNTMATSFVPLTNNDRHSDDPIIEDVQVFHIDEMRNRGDLPSKIDAIKIDTEGAELHVLKSCRELIDQHHPVIYGEINIKALLHFDTDVEQIDHFLHSRNYKIFRNVGKRNTRNDKFQLANLRKLADGGPFFDFIAVHETSTRLPQVVRYYRDNKFTRQARRQIWQALEYAQKLTRLIHPRPSSR